MDIECQTFNSLNSFDSQHPFIKDQYKHSTSLDQMDLDESTVMVFHLAPDCMFNMLAIVNVPKSLETCNYSTCQ